MRTPTVLVACEFSGIVRDAFAAYGCAAVSCDLVGSERPGAHIIGDVTPYLDDAYWDLIIAHPTCKYLTNSANKHLYQGMRRWRDGVVGGVENPIDPERWRGMVAGAAFFLRCWNARHARRVCVENPVMGPHAKAAVGVQQTQVIHPWMFGHPENKATCLWLRNLPPLEATDNVRHLMKDMEEKDANRVHFMSPGPKREQDRSRTYTGIAAAMADQWAPYLWESTANVNGR